jgi:hypothetical protein
MKIKGDQKEKYINLGGISYIKICDNPDDKAFICKTRSFSQLKALVEKYSVIKTDGNFIIHRFVFDSEKKKWGLCVTKNYTGEEDLEFPLSISTLVGKIHNE